MSSEVETIAAGVRVRPATNADRERVKALVFGVLVEFDLRPDPEGTDADLGDIEAGYFRRGGLFELLEDEQGNLLGTVGLYPLDSQTCELRKMYFAPQLRGRGLGRELLARTVEHARRLGFTKITLETASVLESANRLYTKFGFRPIEHEHISPRCDRTYYLNL